MLVHAKRQEMLLLASQAAKAAPKSASAEAVKGIHIEADGRRSMLTLTTTNYEIVIRTSMGACVEQSGSVVVSSVLFPAILSKLPEEDVDLEVETNGRLAIRSGNSCFRLDVLSGDKYPMPELPFPDDTLPVSGLCSLARNTVFAAAEENTQSPSMKCVRLQIGPDGLKACTSNGFCIMEADGDKQCKGRHGVCGRPGRPSVSFEAEAGALRHSKQSHGHHFSKGAGGHAGRCAPDPCPGQRE